MTMKQKLASKKILENPHRPISEVMEEVGYAHNTAIHPKDLTESNGWKQLMDKYLPDDELLKVHKRGLNARLGRKPNYHVQYQYLDLGYKVKGKYLDPATLIQINNTQEMGVMFE